MRSDGEAIRDFIYPDSSFSLTKKENIWFRNNFQIDSIQFKNYYDDIKFVMSKSFATIDAAIVPSHQVNFHFSNRSDINIMGSLDEGEWLIKSSENNDEVWKEVIINNKTYLTMITFHPAYLLRQADQKKYSWADLKEIRKKIDQLNIML